jgi:hypothetical protein
MIGIGLNPDRERDHDLNRDPDGYLDGNPDCDPDRDRHRDPDRME